MASLNDDKATDITVIDLVEKADFADYMVIASGTSRRHINGMTENLKEKIKAVSDYGAAVEGTTHCDWVLIDAGDIIVHLFRPEIRDFYNLEKLWGEVEKECASTS